MRGIMTSISTTSGFSETALLRPSSPSRAVSTSKPAFFNLTSTSRNTSGSSSTARTRTDTLSLPGRNESLNFLDEGVHFEWFGHEIRGAERQHTGSRAQPELGVSSDDDDRNRRGDWRTLE